MTVTDQARSYLAKVDPAVSGSGGHDQTFHSACLLVNGFGLSESEAWPILQEFNQRCQPHWSEKELKHKLASAIKTRHEKPNGHLVKKNGQRVTFGMAPPPAAYTVHTPAPPKRKTATRSYKPEEVTMPEPIGSGTAEHIRAAFVEGEFIRITRGMFDDTGHEIPNPKESRASFTREYWLQKLDSAKGNINQFLSTSERNGIYIAVNPFRENGKDDADVTAFRHVLIEWDRKLTRPQQFDLICKSGLPCTAVIDSGGKSVHAWVRVDAQNLKEYDERVQFIYSHFEESGFPLDPKNKNESRYSRLAGCVRFDSRQELLTLNIGAESFESWRRELEAEDLGPCHQILELISVDTKHDPNCVIGFRDGKTLRYLCKEKSAWIIGPSGIGKSTLTSEFAIGWALGLPVYGITPARPLKSLIIQAENDLYDLAEMAQGIIRAHDLDPNFDPDEKVAQINQNVLFKTEDTCVGLKFIDRLHRLVERENPDLVWVDPLLSFAGIDVNRQDQVSHFLREGINPVLKATGAVMIGIHHTGKLRNSKKEMETWTALDFAYAGLGSSELVNWARAVLTLVPVGGDTFRLELAKRGPRAGAKHPDGSEARSTIYLQHSKKDIRWEQIAPPEDMPSMKEKKEKLPPMPDRIAASNLHSFLRSCPEEGEGVREAIERLELWLAENGQGDLAAASYGTCKTAINLMIGSKKLIKKGSGKKVTIIKGPNA